MFVLGVAWVTIRRGNPGFAGNAVSSRGKGVWDHGWVLCLGPWVVVVGVTKMWERSGHREGMRERMIWQFAKALSDKWK